jgi:hypothetical protein
VDLGWNEWMMIAGGVLIGLAVLIFWRTSKYDLKGAALESAWQTARGRRTAANPTALDETWASISNEATMTGKARRTAGTVLGHFVAQVLGVVATVMLIIGVILTGTGYWWR